MSSDPLPTDGSERRRPARLLALAGVVVLLPYVVPSTVVGAANIGAAYALVAISLVVLTGWVGQISLGQAALVGVGAYMTGNVAGGLGIPFPLSLPFAMAFAAAAAALLGVVALRVRGLYLAVTTLVFSWMASEFLFRQSWFIGNDHIPNRPLGVEGVYPYFDFTSRRTFYFVAWAIVAATAIAAANMRSSKTGRAFFAVKGSEMAAASLGIDVVRTKLLAFAVSGAIAGASGNLMMSDARVVTADQFTFSTSLFFLSIAVVGGLSSLGGAIASALMFAGLTEIFFRVPTLGGYLQIVSSALLAITLVAYPGGLAVLPHRLSPLGRRLAARARPLKDRAIRGVRSAADRARTAVHLRRRAAADGPALLESAPARRGRSRFGSALAKLTATLRRRPASAAVVATPSPLDLSIVLGEAPGLADPDRSTADPSASPPPSENGHKPKGHPRSLVFAEPPSGPRAARTPFIEAENVIVRFGGLTAVNDASLSVREGEIVGLIGPNGAGKTTLFNAIAGYNTPAEGTIRIYGQEVTGLPVHERARLGVARTFQAIQLFGDLTVYRNLLVATHVHNETGFLSHVVASDHSLEAERAARHRVDQVLELLELKDIADRRVADLPFGVLRMVEVSRALVTGFRLMMLDEPASGLDNTETDRLMDVVRMLRGVGVTILLIEHDVRMVTAVSDHIYVLDQGRMIAEGPADEVRNNPAVIAAYLGEPIREAVS